MERVLDYWRKSGPLRVVRLARRPRGVCSPSAQEDGDSDCTERMDRNTTVEECKMPSPICRGSPEGARNTEEETCRLGRSRGTGDGLPTEVGAFVKQVVVDDTKTNEEIT